MPLNTGDSYIDSSVFDYANGVLTAKKAENVAIFVIAFGVRGYSECPTWLYINGNQINNSPMNGTDPNIGHGYHHAYDTTWGDGTLIRYNLAMSVGNTISVQLMNNKDDYFWRCLFIFKR